MTQEQLAEIERLETLLSLAKDTDRPFADRAINGDKFRRLAFDRAPWLLPLARLGLDAKVEAERVQSLTAIVTAYETLHWQLVDLFDKDARGVSPLHFAIERVKELQSQLATLTAERDALQSKLESAHDPKSVGNIAWLAEQYRLRAEKAESELHRIRQSPGITAEQRERLEKVGYRTVAGPMLGDCITAALALIDSLAAALAERDAEIVRLREDLEDLRSALTSLTESTPSMTLTEFRQRHMLSDSEYQARAGGG